MKYTSDTHCLLLLAGRSPSWGAWIEIATSGHLCHTAPVAPPRGERGLKSSMCANPLSAKLVAPPRGERGLKSMCAHQTGDGCRRSPSWGAWIEIGGGCPPLAPGAGVAPPRGERGLKSIAGYRVICAIRRSPSWGAWIEIPCARTMRSSTAAVAPPRGERGLKFYCGRIYAGCR